MSKHSLASTMARGLLAALMAACALGAAAQTAPSTIVIGMGPVPRHLNSAVQSGIATGIPATQIFASPLRFDKDWTPQPYLAESWVFQDDGKSLLLKLVPGALLAVVAVTATAQFGQLDVERIDVPHDLLAAIKSAVDPQNLIAPGRYGTPLRPADRI